MTEGMKKVIRSGPYEIFVLNISTADDFEAPVKGQRFPLLLIDCADSLPEGAMDRISLKLVDSGCKYAVCAGKRSKDWETAFDNADLRRNPNCEDDRFVMTTNTDGEELSEAVFELLFMTSGDVQAEKFVIALVNGREEDVRQIEESINAVRKGDA